MSDPLSAYRRARWIVVPVTSTLLFLLCGYLEDTARVSMLLSIGLRSTIWLVMLGWIGRSIRDVSNELRGPAIGVLSLLLGTAVINLFAFRSFDGLLHHAVAGCWLGMAGIIIELTVRASKVSSEERVTKEAQRIAHKLNNAMMPVVAQTQLLRMVDMSPAERDQALELILKSADQTADWVKQLQQLYDPISSGK